MLLQKPSRLRRKSSLRSLVRETRLSIDDLIRPIFVTHSKTCCEIESMPGIFRFGLNQVLSEVEELIIEGINAIAVFPVIESSKKDEKGSEALNKSNFIAHSINKIKHSVKPNMDHIPVNNTKSFSHLISS